MKLLSIIALCPLFGFQSPLGTELGSASAKGAVRYKSTLRPQLHRVSNTQINPRGRSVGGNTGFMGSGATGSPLTILLQGNLDMEAKLIQLPDGRLITTGIMTFESQDRKFTFNGRVIMAEIKKDAAVVVARGFVKGTQMLMQVGILAPEKGARLERRNLAMLLITPSEIKDENATPTKDAPSPVFWQSLIDTRECYFFSGGASTRIP